MTDTNTSTASKNTPAKTKPSFMLEFGPLLVFFIAFQYLKRQEAYAENAMLMAAGIFAVCAVIALALSLIKHKTVSGMLILSTVIIVVTAGLAIGFENKAIFYMKPTIVNILFGIGVIGGVFFKRNVIEMLMGSAISMPLTHWNTLAIRWGIFFFAMAALNEIIWRNFSEDFWVNFKVFGFFPLTLVFTLTQLPFIQKHGQIKGAE
jgi:intracellular septation protein